MRCRYDRAAQDLGRAFTLEQVDVTPPGRQIATLF